MPNIHIYIYINFMSFRLLRMVLSLYNGNDDNDICDTEYRLPANGGYNHAEFGNISRHVDTKKHIYI